MLLSPLDQTPLCAFLETNPETAIEVRATAELSAALAGICLALFTRPRTTLLEDLPQAGQYFDHLK